jgi:amino acid adenylation domain-containing protein
MVPGLLDELAAGGIRVWTEGRHLRFRAPRGALRAEQRALLAQHKAAVVEELQRRGAQTRLTHPLSYNQASLLFVHAMVPDSAAYSVGFAARVRSELDVAALHEALQALIDRHASLRTTIAAGDGEPRQEVHGHRQVDFAEIDATAWSAPRLAEALEAEQRRPFDLSTGPLFRARLYRRGPGEHVLIMTVHHIVADGWSGWLLLQELAVLYGAHGGGSASTLPLPGVEYADYVQWQRDQLAAQGEALWAYWQKRCAGIPALGLSTDRPRPPVPSQRGATHRFTLDAALSQQLRALARSEGTTLYTVLLAAFQILLHRYTAQDDIAVGSPTFGRSEPRFEAVVGHFVNMLVLRADLSGRPSFRAFLGQVRETVLGALAHQDFPFALLVERLGGSRDPSRSPVFQATFQLQQPQRSVDVAGVLTGPRLAAGSGDLVLEPLPLAQQEGQFDLSLDVTDLGGPLEAAIKYSTDLFEPGTIARMQRHLEVLLAAITENPERPVSDLPLLTAAERERIVTEWNRTETLYPHDRCLHELVEAQAERTPEALALVCGETRLTYGQLERRANQLARYLRTRGVGPEVLVGICAERSVEMVVGVLGILKAGGAYVPLDPAHPEERLRFVLEDTGAPLVVTQDAVRERLPRGAVGLVSLDGDWPAIAGESPEAPATSVRPEQLAYVIYTSGSTGKPKGVAIPHGAVVNFLLSMQKEPAVAAADVLVAVTTLSFDIAALELLLPLTVGACVVVASRERAMDGRELATLLAQSGATVMQATPATWRMLIESGWVGAPTFKVLCGGEALSRDLAAALLKRAGEVWNLYGPTETTIWSTRCRVGASEGPVPIGRPLANTQMYVLDAHGQPVPIGVAGELYIGGNGVARGYLNRPELTSERFVPDPFRDVPGARLYRTGDLARYWANGDLECLGRLDHQVKIRGFRIEAGEVEEVLRQHPTVQQAAVLAREDRPGDRRLVAYVVPTTGSTLEPPALREFARRQLPDYMVPSAFVALDSLPLTPNAKVDRKALPAPELAAAKVAVEFVAPRTEFERTIAEIWRTVLGVDQVGLHDNFFDVGGHSLLLVRVQRRLEQALGRMVPVVTMFECPTVVSLAERLTATPAEGGTGRQRAVNRAALQRDAIGRARARSVSR